MPARELLSIYPNFMSLYEKYKLPYDETFRDAIIALGMPDLNKPTEALSAVLTNLEKAIRGKIFLDAEKNRFYLRPEKSKRLIEMDMTAEGWRRTGMIMQLLKNGTLTPGMTLFWDEPESNLNPKLIRCVASTIFSLAETGIQVFIATHSLFLVNELEIIIAKHKMRSGIRYFNLRAGEAVEQGDSFAELHDVLLDESMDQADRYLDDEV